MSNQESIHVCFHGIGKPGRELEPGEDAYWITTDQFYRILEDLVEWPNVELSFDDGNASDITIGLPALQERGRTAQFFPIAGRLDKPGSLGTSDLKELSAQGMAVGSHGMWHRPWRRMTPRDVHSELVLARNTIAAAVDRPVETASCPFGGYDRRVLSALRREGYRTVYTSDRKPAHPGDWLQPRYSVYRHHTPETLRTEVLGRRGPIRRLRTAGVGVIKRWR